MLVRCNKADDPRCPDTYRTCSRKLPHESAGDVCSKRFACVRNPELRIRCVKVKEPEYELAYCETCAQMANHLGGVCQKCKVKEEEKT
jgi:hypothetical protein